MGAEHLKEKKVKKYFITGLVILLPLAITISILRFVIDLLTEPFVEMVAHFLDNVHFVQRGVLFLSKQQVLLYSSKILILLFLFLFTLTLGALTRWFFVHTLLRASDKLFQRIPFIGALYNTTRDVLKTFTNTERSAFTQVALVPFPRPGIYAIALISGSPPSSSCSAPLTSVLILTTPNPTTGFLVLVKKEDLIPLDISVEDAIKYIVSCGLLTPKSPTKIQHQ